MSQTAVLASAMLLNTGVSAFSTNANANAQASAYKAQGEYQNQQLKTNAAFADLQATDAMNRGDKAAVQKQRQVKQLIGSQRAALAAQGIEVNADSALDVQSDTAGMGALDVLTIKNNAWREAMGYKVAALDYTGQASYALTAAKMNASNTLLTGGLTVAKDVTSGVYSYMAANNATKLKTK